MKYEILVKLKQEVLDPEGRAIRDALAAQNIQGVVDCEVSKRYVLEIDPKTKTPDQVVQKIAANYLANPVSQDFEIKILSSP